MRCVRASLPLVTAMHFLCIEGWLTCCRVQDRQKGGFKKEVEEEFEDNDGNVYNRKTYEDLKKQGLI